MELKKRLVLIVLFTVIGLVIVFLITMPKKKTINLIDNYKIIKVKDNTKLVFNKKEIVTDYIAEYSYGKRYILLKCVDKDINIKFYIIDTKDDWVHGPYSDNETFELVKKEIVSEKIDNWIKIVK